MVACRRWQDEIPAKTPSPSPDLQEFLQGAPETAHSQQLGENEVSVILTFDNQVLISHFSDILGWKDKQPGPGYTTNLIIYSVIYCRNDTILNMWVQQ